MHLKRRPSKLLKLFAGDPAALALMAVAVKTLLAFSPPRGTGVVGAVRHWWAPPGGRPPNNTTAAMLLRCDLRYSSEGKKKAPLRAPWNCSPHHLASLLSPNGGMSANAKGSNQLVTNSYKSLAGGGNAAKGTSAEVENAATMPRPTVCDGHPHAFAIGWIPH